MKLKHTDDNKCIHNVSDKFQNLFVMVSSLSSAACCSSHNVNV